MWSMNPHKVWSIAFGYSFLSQAKFSLFEFVLHSFSSPIFSLTQRIWENGIEENQPLKTWAVVNQLPDGPVTAYDSLMLDLYLIDFDLYLIKLISILIFLDSFGYQTKVKFELETKSVENLNFIVFIYEQFNFKCGHYTGQALAVRDLRSILSDRHIVI